MGTDGLDRKRVFPIVTPFYPYFLIFEPSFDLNTRNSSSMGVCKMTL